MQTDLDKKLKANAFGGIGLVFFMLGIVQFIDEENSKPTGKWSFILIPIWESFGDRGIAFLWIIVGVMFIMYFLIERLKK